MNEVARPMERYQPALVNHTVEGHSTVWTIGLGTVLLAVVAAVELLPPASASWLVTTAAIVLAAVGVVSLFAHALGLVTLRTGATGDVYSRAVVAGDRDGVLVTGANGQVLYANRAYADLTGALKVRDVLPVDRVFGDAADGALYRLNRLADEGREASCEASLPSPEGERRYSVECRPVPHQDGDGSAVADRKESGLLVWRVRDVTEETEARAAEFRELRHAIECLDSVPVGCFSLDAEGRVTFMNTYMASLLGLDATEVPVRRLKRDDIIVAGPRARRTLGDGSQIEEVELKGSVAERMPFRLHTVRAEREGVASTHCLLLSGEEASAAPRGAVELLAASPMAIASLDAAGRILHSNRAFAEAFRMGGTVPAFLHEIAGDAEQDALQEAFDDALRHGAPRPLEIVTAGDEIIRIHMVSPGNDEGEQGERVLLYALEVTEQRAMEREMADAQKNQAIGVIAGGVAHDFNNVLTAIVGFSDLLLAKYRPSDRSFHDVTQIRNTAFKGASLVRQLLAYTRRQTLRPKTLSMPDVLTDLSMILRRLAGDTIRVEVKHGRDLWLVRADVGALERVFVNLCVNARDAINDRVETERAEGRKPGEGVIRIRTRNVEIGEAATLLGDADAPVTDQLLIEVSDTGTGMTKEVMAKIFDPFFTTKKAGKGTGLGLSSVVGIVKQSGGAIRLSSQLGEGTTFRIFLPRHVPVEGEAELPVAAPKEAARDLAGTATILFVEDEDPVRAFGTRTLKERGYTVHEAENGEDALEIIEELDGNIDLVVSDVVMPEMDGPTLFRHVREMAPDLPFIFASGYAEEAFEKSLPDATEARFGFIPKPYTLKDLAILVKDTLEAPDKAA